MCNVNLLPAFKRYSLPLPILTLLSALSGALLSIPFISPQHYWLAWVGFIPLLFAIEGASLLRSYFFGAIAGLVFSISAGYWVIHFLMLSKGYSVIISTLFAMIFWIYSAQLIALIALIFNWIKRHITVHECILFPMTVVSICTAYPMIFTVHWGESQSQFLAAIQATAFVGVYGLDAIIALTNVVLFRLVLRMLLIPRLTHRQAKWPYAIATLLVTSWFYYGWSSSLAWESKIKHWETIRIGLVQPNETPTLKKQMLYPGYSRAFPPEMAMTERLASAGAKIVIWPEAKYKAYFDHPNVAKAYLNQINALNTRLIFQDIERIQDSFNSPIIQQYNTALMLSNKGQIIGKYQKMKRIAFGEYVPFASDIPILKRWVEGFFGPFLNEMGKGTSHQVFKSDLLNDLLNDSLPKNKPSKDGAPKKKPFIIIPLICYETMFPEFVAKAVSEALTNVQTAGLLVGLSSDGWFGMTHQPYQHVNNSILRAVENRLPLVHVLNNGPSIVAMPNGKVIFTTDAHQAGGYIVDVPYGRNSQGSFFSHHPRLFINSVYGLISLIFLYSLLKFRQKISHIIT
jgi:apolipoprotein N-acyltransferase